MKELDNSYHGEPHGATMPLSNDAINVGDGLDSILVSNVTQTLSGGMTIGTAETPVSIPAGTPIVMVGGEPTPVTSASTLTSANTGAVVGVAVRSFVYGVKPVSIAVAKSAHVNVNALCDALAETIGSFDKDAYKTAYINDDWHKNLCLTFEQNL